MNRKKLSAVLDEAADTLGTLFSAFSVIMIIGMIVIGFQGGENMSDLQYIDKPYNPEASDLQATAESISRYQMIYNIASFIGAIAVFVNFPEAWVFFTIAGFFIIQVWFVNLICKANKETLTAIDQLLRKK